MNTIKSSILGGFAVILASCAAPMNPNANVEQVERQAPVTPTPNVGQHEAGRNAVDYANDRLPRYRYGYGNPYYRGY